MSAYDYVIKLLLIGESGAGKTSLLLRYDRNTFSDVFISTIGIDFKIKYIVIDKKHIKLQIWDTAGQERFKTITSSYYRGSHGVFIVYDITNRISFNNATKWINDISNNIYIDVVKILIGNKCDLSERRAVTTIEGQTLANSYGIQFFETSAKTGENIEKIFETIATNIYDNVKLQEHVIIKEPQKNNSRPLFSSCC